MAWWRTHKVLAIKEPDDSIVYSICEAHYADGKEEKQFEWATDVFLMWDSIEELKKVIEMMLRAVENTIDWQKSIIETTAKEWNEKENKEAL